MKIEITTPQGVKVEAEILKAGQGPVVPPVDPPEPVNGLYRQLHDYELGVCGVNIPATQYGGDVWYWRAIHGHPEVFWVDGGSKTPFTAAWQYLSKDMNPSMTGKKWRVVYDEARAFMNKTGFASSITPERKPQRVDYVNGIDLFGEMPAWDKIRTCGGFTMKGIVDGDWFYPDHLEYDPTKPNDGAPTWAWLKERPWLYFHAVTCHSRNGTQATYPFAQGGGEAVLIPFVAMAGSELRIPIQAVEAVDTIRDPYKIYIM